MSRAVTFFWLFIFIFSAVTLFPAQAQSAATDEGSVSGSLAEIRNKRRLFLIVRRSAVVDASGSANSVLSDLYKPDDHRMNFPRTYNQMAQKLNKYMKERGSITAAQSAAEAEFIIFFNVLEVRRPLGTPYAYGELFVILNEPKRPRIIWKTKKTGMFAADAMNALIRDLKDARGER